MSLPIPVIYLPKASDQIVLMRGLYALGYKYGGRSLPSAIHDWSQHTGPDLMQVTYPYMMIELDDKRVTASIRRPSSGTPINSIRQFLSYVRRFP